MAYTKHWLELPGLFKLRLSKLIMEWGQWSLVLLSLCHHITFLNLDLKLHDFMYILFSHLRLSLQRSSIIMYDNNCNCYGNICVSKKSNVSSLSPWSCVAVNITHSIVYGCSFFLQVKLCLMHCSHPLWRFTLTRLVYVQCVACFEKTWCYKYNNQMSVTVLWTSAAVKQFVFLPTSLFLFFMLMWPVWRSCCALLPVGGLEHRHVQRWKKCSEE